MVRKGTSTEPKVDVSKPINRKLSNGSITIPKEIRHALGLDMEALIGMQLRPETGELVIFPITFLRIKPDEITPLQGD